MEEPQAHNRIISPSAPPHPIPLVSLQEFWYRSWASRWDLMHRTVLHYACHQTTIMDTVDPLGASHHRPMLAFLLLSQEVPEHLWDSRSAGLHLQSDCKCSTWGKHAVPSRSPPASSSVPQDSSLCSPPCVLTRCGLASTVAGLGHVRK